MKQNRKPILMVCVLILLLILIGGTSFVIKRFMPSKDRVDLNEYYGTLDENRAHVILNAKQADGQALIADGMVYLPLDFVTSKLNQSFYFDQEGNQILYASPGDISNVPVSEEPGGEAFLKDGKLYLQMDYILRYTNLYTEFLEDPSRIVIQTKLKDLPCVMTKKETDVRYQGGIKSEILTTVPLGTNLVVIEELDNWIQVATLTGFRGYVEKKCVQSADDLTIETGINVESYQYLTMDQKVNLVWHQVTNQESNDYFAEDTAAMTGVNVISPTWFSVTDNEGNISSIASQEYVEQAHARGLQVWGLIDNFNENVNTAELLSSTTARWNLISLLVNQALSVGMDGINIDFESLNEEAGPHFIQFLRELSVMTHKNNLVLSVDDPVPEDFTAHYDRTEQGRVVDYVIIMGYDEHYVGSEQAGPVASFPWVEKGVQDTLEEVPADRVINAIPFYTRLWKVSDGVLTSEAIGMDTALEAVTSRNGEITWDANAGQNYSSFETEEGTFQIWLEDEQSITAKTLLVPRYGLAGIAAWKLGFENDGIWQVIQNNLNG
ncbi:MAG: SH3 domain-containing protein [Blautia sp.]|nr:SH3 domain-containing protein [Blautia sp.]